MSLADDLLVPVRGTDVCETRRILEQLDVEDPKAAAALRTALAMPYTQMPAAELGRRLRKAGFDASDRSLARHRKGDCLCPR